MLTPPSAGYARIVLAVASLYYMPIHPRTCCGLYSISCLLDALDGAAARRFQQSTRFGAVLDMVTDRCTTSCLLVFLASAFPRWSILFQGLISLDLASHYMHMYATLTMGGHGQSHKKVDESRSWVLKQYYSNNVRSMPSLYARSANVCAEGTIHILRPERGFLHRALSSVLLLPDPFTVSPSTCACFSPARKPGGTQAIHDLHHAVVGGGNGDGKGE